MTSPDPSQIQPQTFPFTVEGLLSYMRSLPPETTYIFTDTKDCLLMRFGRLSAPYFDYLGLINALFKEHAIKAEHCFITTSKLEPDTYGIALQQLEHFLLTGRSPRDE